MVLKDISSVIIYRQNLIDCLYKLLKTPISIQQNYYRMTLLNYPHITSWAHKQVFYYARAWSVNLVVRL